MILNPGGQAEDKETGQKGGREYSFKKLCFILCCFDFVIFKRFYLFIFRERGREGKRGEEHRCESCLLYTSDAADDWLVV